MALADVASGKSNVYAANMSEGILRHRMKLKLAGKSLIGSGRRPSLEQHEEMQLTRCIGSMCRLGFSPTRGQIKDLLFLLLVDGEYLWVYCLDLWIYECLGMR